MKEHPSREDRDQIEELLNQFENIRKGRANSFLEEESYQRIIDYYHEKEEYSKAMDAVGYATEQYPYSGSLLVKKADILLALHQYQDALNVLELASLFDKGDINLYILKTDAYLALDQQEKAVTLLEEALEMFEAEEKVELLFELADVYDDYEEFDKVFDCLKMILEHEPNNEEALYKICFWTDFTGRNEESIRLHTKIIDNYPYSELAWFNLAAAYQGLKLYEKAIDAYKYAITIDEKFDYAYRNMGDAYIRLRKYKEAIEALEKVNELSKPEDVIYEAIGHCYDRLQDYAKARFYYRKATHMRPDDAKLIYKLACTYYNEDRWQKCISQMEHGLKMPQAQAEYYILVGECRVALEQFRDAAQNFLDAVRLRPKNSSAWEALIRCLYKGEFFTEAIEQVEAASYMTDNKPIFTYYHAALLFATGKTKEALIKLENAMEKAPKMLKKFIELNPGVLQNPAVVDVVARFKRNRSI